MRVIFIILLINNFFLQCNLFISEEQRVFNVIRKGERAIEKEDTTVLQQIIAKDYRDDWGHNYDRLIQWFAIYFYRYKNIKVHIIKNELTVGKKIATCRIKAYISGYDDYNDELTVDNIELTLYLEKINKIWFVIKATQTSLDREIPSIEINY